MVPKASYGLIVPMVRAGSLLPAGTASSSASGSNDKNGDSAFYCRQLDASFRPVHDGYARFGNWPDGGGSEILAEEPRPAETVGRLTGSHDLLEQREAAPLLAPRAPPAETGEPEGRELNALST